MSKVFVIAVKQVEVGEEFEPLSDAEKRLLLMNWHGQGLYWRRMGDGEVVTVTLAPDALDLVALIESTYAFKPEEGVDIGTADLARNILALFGCGEYDRGGAA